MTQETFYRAVRKIDKYKGECKISVWLCQIAKNFWYDECRNKRTINTGEDSLFDIQETNTLEEEVIANDEKMLLYKKLQLLDDKTREVL